MAGTVGKLSSLTSPRKTHISNCACATPRYQTDRMFEHVCSHETEGNRMRGYMWAHSRERGDWDALNGDREIWSSALRSLQPQFALQRRYFVPPTRKMPSESHSWYRTLTDTPDGVTDSLQREIFPKGHARSKIAK